MTARPPSCRVGMALPLLLAVLPFVHSMGGFRLVWEDPGYLLRNKSIQSLRNIPRFFGLRYWNEENPTPTRSYRPIRETAFALDYALWGGEAAGYRFSSIVLHAAATACFYALAVMWLPGHGRVPAGLAACVFALHPTRVETVVYAKNKAEILAAIFILLAVIAWDRTMRARGSGVAKLLRYGGVLGLFVLAMTSKASAIALPMALAAAACCRARGGKSALRGLAGLAPFVVVACVFVYASVKYIDRETGLTGELGSLPMRWRPALVAETWHGYLGISLLPVNLHADRLLVTPGGPWWAWQVGLAGWCLLALVCARQGPRTAPAITFGAAWFVIFLSPVLNVILLEGRPLAEQRLYVPFAGLCLCVAAVVGARRSRRAWLLAGLIACAALCCQRVFVWRTSQALWFDNVLASPQKSKPRNNAGVHYGKAGRYSLARAQLTKAVSLNPKLGDSMYNLAAICRKQGKLHEANVWYSRLLQLDPDRDDAWLSAGNVFWELKMYGLAEKAFRSLLERKPKDFRAYTSLAGVYLDQKRYGAAEAMLRQALLVEPDKADLYVNLGQLMEDQNRRREAIEHYTKAIELDASNSLAYTKLGQMWYRDREYKLAKQALTAAVNADAKNWQAWVGLACIAQAQHDRPAFDAAAQRVRELKPDAAASLKWTAGQTP